MYLVLDSIPFRRVPPAPLCCNCNAASLWHRVCCCCCMSAPFSMLCRLAAAVVCVFFFPPPFSVGGTARFPFGKDNKPNRLCNIFNSFGTIPTTMTLLLCLSLPSILSASFFCQPAISFCVAPIWGMLFVAVALELSVHWENRGVWFPRIS